MPGKRGTQWPHAPKTVCPVIPRSGEGELGEFYHNGSNLKEVDKDCDVHGACIPLIWPHGSPNELLGFLMLSNCDLLSGNKGYFISELISSICWGILVLQKSSKVLFYISLEVEGGFCPKLHCCSLTAPRLLLLCLCIPCLP